MRSRYSEHLDLITPPCDLGEHWGIHRRPPCNVYALTLVAVIASAAIQYDSANKAATQAKWNAEAQSDALKKESDRQRMEDDENRRRAVMAQRRARASQLASLSSSGAALGTGTALEIEADTWQKQQVELADRQYVADLSQRELNYQAGSALQIGNQQAAAYKREGNAALVAGLASAAGVGYSAWSTRPQQAPQNYAVNRYSRQPMASSTNV